MDNDDIHDEDVEINSPLNESQMEEVIIEKKSCMKSQRIKKEETTVDEVKYILELYLIKNK
jgi:hypothetical protein